MAQDEDVLQGAAGVVEGEEHTAEDREGTMSTGVSEPGGVVRLGGDTSIRRWCVWGNTGGGGATSLVCIE